MTHLWIRSETRPSEERTPLTPHDARTLMDSGIHITVERSLHRVFADADYLAAQVPMVEEGSWVDAPDDAIIVGVKELPHAPAALHHTHVMFGHAYKGQIGGEELLARFVRGGGTLLDFEYVTRNDKREIAFGYFAGYVGSALAILASRGQLHVPLTPMSRTELDAALRSSRKAPHEVEKVLITGAHGRSGRGACEAAEVAGCELTKWGVADTRQLDKQALLQHDILVNCVFTETPHEPFVTDEDLSANEHRLHLISDVTCDVTSDCNLLPVNDQITTWSEPIRRLHTHEACPVDVIAIDNLPSLLPREASERFSAQFVTLVPSLATRSEGWAESARAFAAHVSTSLPQESR